MTSHICHALAAIREAIKHGHHQRDRAVFRMTRADFQLATLLKATERVAILESIERELEQLLPPEGPDAA